MNLDEIKKVKSIFRDTGRLNANIVRKEIAISWYRCFLLKLSNKTLLDSSMKIDSNQRNCLGDFLLTVNWLESCDIYVLSADLEVEWSSAHNTFSIRNFDEYFCGTNAASISKKTQNDESVFYSEHYLDMLEGYCTYSLFLKESSKIILLMSSEMLDASLLLQLKDKLSHLCNGIQSIRTSKCELNLKNVLSFPSNYYEVVEAWFHRVTQKHNPIIINGDVGSGKNTLALFIGYSLGLFPIIIDVGMLNETQQLHVIEGASLNHELLIIKNANRLSKKTTRWLLSIIDSRSTSDSEINHKTKVKQFVFIGLTEGDIYSRYASSRIILSSYSGSLAERVDILENMIHRLKLKGENIDTLKFAYESRHLSLKEIANALQNTLELSDIHKVVSKSHKTLEEIEKEYIVEVLIAYEGNIAVASEVLGIGRSTLYRKIEKYQIDTQALISL